MSCVCATCMTSGNHCLKGKIYVRTFMLYVCLCTVLSLFAYASKFAVCAYRFAMNADNEMAWLGYLL